MIDLNSPELVDDRERFFGSWTEESDACAELDRRIAASGLFEKSFPECRGYYMAQRPNRRDQDARIDRILIPGTKLREAGWTSAVGVEIKASGSKLGPALSQAIDYTYCCFWAGSYPMPLPHIFLWPMRPQHGAVQSVMVQNCIGTISDAKRSPLIFTLERQVIRIEDNGAFVVAPTVAGTKKGSR